MGRAPTRRTGEGGADPLYWAAREAFCSPPWPSRGAVARRLGLCDTTVSGWARKYKWEAVREERRAQCTAGEALPPLVGPAGAVAPLVAAQEQATPSAFWGRADGWPTSYEVVTGNVAALREIMEVARAKAPESRDPQTLAGWAAIVIQAAAAIRAEYGVPHGAITPTSEEMRVRPAAPTASPGAPVAGGQLTDAELVRLYFGEREQADQGSQDGAR